MNIRYASYYPKELFNFCILSGICRYVFKFVQFTPIQKKFCPRNISKYRPVSMLSNIAKVFEKLIYKRLQVFGHTFNFLAKIQFGFREIPKPSVEFNGENTTYEEHAIYVFLNYCDCFDTPSRSILYDKLERYGMLSVSLDFVKAFFAYMSQYMCFGAVKSSIKGQELGSPKGSN